MPRKGKDGAGHAQGAREGQVLPARPIPELGDETGHIRDAHEGHARRARPVAETIAIIRSWHRRRCYVMEQRKRADLALGSFLRTMLGWSLNIPAAEREIIRQQASALVDLGEREAKGKPVETDDPAYAEWRDVILASIAARAPFDGIEKRATAEMEAAARDLPVWPFVDAIRGFGALGLAVIIGEAGDIGTYRDKGCLRKRMGVAVIGGIRQGGLAKSAGKDAWIEHGYNRMRRSRMWVIGQSLVKGNGDGKYRAAYLARKDYERSRAEAAGLKVVPAAKVPKGKTAEYMTLGHIDRRAQRCMEQRLLEDLRKEWRRVSDRVSYGAIYRTPAAVRDEGRARLRVPETATEVLPAPRLAAE